MANETRPILPKFCGSCGKELLQGADFCAYCGAPVPKLDTQFHPPTAIPSHYVTPRASMAIAEPPLPFIKNFQGVLLTPHEEMPKIIERPNLKQPFILNLLVGILAGVAIAVFLSKVSITVFPQFSQDFQEIVPSDFDFESYLRFSLIIGSFIGPIVLWLVDSAILYLLLVILAPTVPSSTRNFKTTATIAGWASVPQLAGEIFNIIYNILFVQGMTIELREIGDIQNIVVPIVSGPIDWILSGFEIGLLIWGVLLVYWALKSIVPQGNQPVIISTLYIVTRIVVSFLLTTFLI